MAPGMDRRISSAPLFHLPHEDLSHLSTLQWCSRDGRTSGVTLPSTWPGVAGVMAKSPLSKQPKTPMELPGEDRGGDPSPRPGMREREKERGLREKNETTDFVWLRETFHELHQLYKRSVASWSAVSHSDALSSKCGIVCKSERKGVQWRVFKEVIHVDSQRIGAKTDPCGRPSEKVRFLLRALRRPVDEILCRCWMVEIDCFWWCDAAVVNIWRTLSHVSWCSWVWCS